MAIRDFGTRLGIQAAWEDTFLVCLGKRDPAAPKQVTEEEWVTISRMGRQGYTAIQAVEKYLEERSASSAVNSDINTGSSK